MKPLAFILLSSFVAGVATGVYIFFTTRPADDTVTRAPHERTGGFEIVADRFGGCERIGCPSYRLTDDGSYTYILAERNLEDIRKEGSLSVDEKKALKANVEETDFESLKNTRFAGTCPSDFDGPAYRFTIKLGGDSLAFDSCKENIEGNTFFDGLIKYFDVFENSTESSSGL